MNLYLKLLHAIVLFLVSFNVGNFDQDSGSPPVTDQPAIADRPNIVVILADDLGYGDTLPLNPESNIPTPAFEQLAREGMLFSDAHSGSAVCTPTRYGLLCGRYAWRTRLKNGVLGGYSKPLIDCEQQTLALQLQSAGYDTHVVGKWHLGLGWVWSEEEPDNINHFGIAGNRGSVDYSQPLTDGPQQHGFDTCFLFPASLDMSPYVFIRDDSVFAVPDKILEGQPFPQFYRRGEAPDEFDVQDVLGQLTAEATSFIRAKAQTEDPFFLYFPLTAPHKPVAPSDDVLGLSGLGPYGDFVHQVDRTVGEVITALEEAGISDNTLLVVTSDNGSFMFRDDTLDSDHVDDHSIQAYHPDHHKPNGELRGTKADIWEAGHRVPFYVRWPGGMLPEHIGTRCESTICLTDLLATCCTIAGSEFDAVASPDSFDFSPLIVSAEPVFDRPPVIHHSISGMFAIRDGRWKLVLGNGSGGRQQPRGKMFEGPYELYDLLSDPSESNNVIESNDLLAKELEAKLFALTNGDHEKR